MTDDFLQRFEERRTARQQAERSFDIAGVTLTFRAAVAPEVGMRLEGMRQEVRAQLERLRTAADEVDKAREKNGAEVDLSPLEQAVDAMTVTDAAMLQIGDETVIACLTEKSKQGWAELRSETAEQPLTFDEVFEIADYLLGRVAGIPTSGPADSSDGPTETDKPSKAKSSSPAIAPTT